MDLPGPFDYAFSRMGIMFFGNPVVAMRNVRAALAPGGRLVAAVWRRKLDNPWLHRAEQVVDQYLEEPEETDEPTCGPGPFSMADADTVSEQLTLAGFEQISLRRCDLPIKIGNDLDHAVEFNMAIGPAGELIRLAGDEAERSARGSRRRSARRWRSSVRVRTAWSPPRRRGSSPPRLASDHPSPTNKGEAVAIAPVELFFPGGAVVLLEQVIATMEFSRHGQGAPASPFHWVSISVVGLDLVDVYASREPPRTSRTSSSARARERSGCPRRRSSPYPVHNYLTGPAA